MTYWRCHERRPVLRGPGPRRLDPDGHGIGSYSDACLRCAGSASSGGAAVGGAGALAPGSIAGGLAGTVVGAATGAVQGCAEGYTIEAARDPNGDDYAQATEDVFDAYSLDRIGRDLLG